MKSDLLREITNEKQNLKFFHILCSIYIATMIISLTVSARLLPFHIPFTNTTILLTAGTWTIPISFFIQDITTEVYGYQRSRQLIQVSVVILAAYVLYMKFTTFFPIPSVNSIDTSYNTLCNVLPRHFLALLAAIFTGNIINDYILSQLKRKLNGRFLAIRFILSTAIGEAALQLVGTTTAWLGNLNFSDQIVPFVIFSYFYKLTFEVIMTPINIFVCDKLKNFEGIDVYDFDIDYNPFVVRSKRKAKE